MREVILHFLDVTLSGFDYSIIAFMHSLRSDFATLFFKFISFLGDDGILYILTGLVLLLFSKTRSIGFTMLFSIAFGALVTNITLKNWIMRARPFNSGYSEYNIMWQELGSPSISGFSFPSGHSTGTMATCMGVFLATNKKWSWALFIYAFTMGLSRIYLMAHYPTDVIAGFIVGLIAGTVGYYVTKLIYKLSIKHSDCKLFKFLVEFDIIKVFKKNK